MHSLRNALIASALFLGAQMTASAAMVRITVTNTAPANGIFFTPVWFGFHDGTFDTYDAGAPASSQLEAIAEDGDVGPIGTLFSNTANAGSTGGVVFGTPVIGPGQSFSAIVNVDPMAGRYFSFLSMVIPSNDFFIGNGNPTQIEIFDAGGNFLGADFIPMSVRDAGTEVNDEIPMNTAFFGQMMPNTGVDENGVVSDALGFIPMGAILSDPMFANASFQNLLRIQVTAVPEPGTMALLGLALPALALLRRRR